jgi:hypothetical protein
MLVSSMSVSVDGFIADRDGAFGWTAPSDEHFRFQLAQTRELGGYPCGRRADTAAAPHGRPAPTPAVAYAVCSRWRKLSGFARSQSPSRCGSRSRKRSTQSLTVSSSPAAIALYVVTQPATM